VDHSTRYHLLSSLGLFITISIFLVIFNYHNLEIIYLVLGIALGTFFLDLDHLIFWLVLKPNLDESRLAKAALEKKDFKSIIRLVKLTHQKHHNLIFHHYFFQVILVFFSFFILTSTVNIFASSFLLTLNLHLLVDEVISYQRDPKTLQHWLFARESKQLPIKFLRQYIIIFGILFIFLTLLLIQTKT